MRSLAIYAEWMEGVKVRFYTGKEDGNIGQSQYEEETILLEEKWKQSRAPLELCSV